MKNYLTLFLMTLGFLSGFAQNNISDDYLKKFLEEYPMYKEDLAQLYFEHVGMNTPRTKQYFDVYKREYVGDDQIRVSFFGTSGQLETGTILYMLFPVHFSTHRAVITPSPPPRIDDRVKCIILSRRGTSVLALKSLRMQ